MSEIVKSSINYYNHIKMMSRYATKSIYKFSSITVLQPKNMVYNNFGNSGLKISQLSFGNAINCKPKNYEQDKNIIKCCLNNGINHFDTAEVYDFGGCETQLGNILKDLQVPRQHVVIATKINTAPEPEINTRGTTNRKHIRESIHKSLKRLQMDNVDILYAHLYDYTTPMEQICRGFHEAIEEGSAFYWATSNWHVQSVIEALSICERLNLHKPIGGQNQYNMLMRYDQQVQSQLLFKKYNYGLISWGSLAGGFLTEKHLKGSTDNIKTRFNDSSFWFVTDEMKTLYNYKKNNTEQSLKKLRELQQLAQSVGYSLNHLALAWVMKFKYMNSALLGARSVAQLEDSLKCLELLNEFTPQFEGKVNKILGNTPEPRMNFLTWTQYPPIRPVASH